LYDIITSAKYRPGWCFALLHEDRGQGSEGLTLSIFSKARPFAPNHGPGRNPYSVLEVGRVEDAETRFTGERVEGSQT
jgi:hypothetical protein